MTEDDLLERYGLHPAGGQLDEIRGILATEMQAGFDANTELMKICCIQLFHYGSLNDVLLIWEAKESGWDAHCSIDVQLLCGAGLDETKAFLRAHPATLAREALEYLTECEEARDFDSFSVERWSEGYHSYYGVPLPD
ncbi:hypothetical protein DMP23_21690 [Amycolatopsis sp. A1MSW2902]|uniref:hypothetical protein n=1 Tax=Amycolatopsis TaxID=1813 RepID=UPI00106FB378|nr:hypothetical protein [Amycolatopsis nivea]